MTPHQVIGVAVRLFAVWLMMYALQAVNTGIALHLSPSSGAYLFSGFFIIVAIFLWLFPLFVAHGLVPRTRHDDALRIPAQQVTTVATVVLGLWLLAVRAIPAVIFYVTLAVYLSENGQKLSALPSEKHITFIVGVVELVVAMALIFKAPYISNFILNKHKESEDE